MQLARWSWPARKSSERERSGEQATFCSSRSAHACSGNSDVILFQLVFSYRHVVGKTLRSVCYPYRFVGKNILKPVDSILFE